MKTKASIYFKVFFVCVILSAVLILIFTAMVGINLKSEVDSNLENIPYEDASAVNNCGVLLNFEGGGSQYFYFDAKNNQTTVLLLKNNATQNDVLNYGYNVNAELTVPYFTLADFIDRFGGVKMKTDQEGILNYSGVQVAEMLSKTNDQMFKKQITKQILNSIKNVGFTHNDLLFLINNTTTDLSFPNGYFIPEVINNSLGSVIFAN